MDVKYPRNTSRIGFLKLKGEQLWFVSLDKKFNDMIVREVREELWEQIKAPNELQKYSYIKKSRVDPRFVEKHFFKGEFTNWSAFEMAPYAKLNEDLGHIFDEANYRKIIMLN